MLSRRNKLTKGITRWNDYCYKLRQGGEDFRRGWDKLNAHTFKETHIYFFFEGHISINYYSMLMLLQPNGLIVRTFYVESWVQIQVTTFSLARMCVYLIQYMLMKHIVISSNKWISDRASVGKWVLLAFFLNIYW